ncbi:hypothetical protein, partial [Streptomyces angustmyceticus]
MNRVPPLAGALGLTLLAGLLGACGDSPHLDACAWMKEPVESAGRTVVLVDDSASVRGRSTGRDYAHSIGALLAKVVARKDLVSVGSFSGDSAQITWIAKDRSADWATNNDNAINREKRKAQAVGCLTGLVGKASSTAPHSGGSNVLAALTAGASSLEEAPGRR